MSYAADPIEARKACTELVLWFASRGKASRSGRQSKEVVTTQSAMANAYPQISDSALARDLVAAKPVVDLGGWIYGAETGHRASESIPEIIPAITLSWSWQGANPSLQILVALLLAGLDAQDGLKAWAFRFETADKGTTHDFHHAQPTAKLTHRGDPLEGVGTPLHESVPAFPLDATGPVGIIICLLLSLYGRTVLESMFTQDPHLRNIVHPHLDELPAFNIMSARQGAGSRSSVGETVTVDSGSRQRNQGASRSGRRKRL